jgi:hypothetical protein
MHNNENVGEWSDDLVNEVAEKLKKSKSKSEKKIAQNGSLQCYFRIPTRSHSRYFR